MTVKLRNAPYPVGYTCITAKMHRLMRRAAGSVNSTPIFFALKHLRDISQYWGEE